MVNEIFDYIDDKNKEIKIIHKTPNMADIEREKNKKRIGNDLYEIFLRIQKELKPDNE